MLAITNWSVVKIQCLILLKLKFQNGDKVCRQPFGRFTKDSMLEVYWDHRCGGKPSSYKKLKTALID